MTEFLGKSLACEMIVSSCHLTSSPGSVKAFCDAGLGGAILKTCADYEREAVAEQFCCKRNADDKYLYISSPFQKEILTIAEGIDLLCAVRPQTDALLIPSVTSSAERSLSLDGWLPACQSLAAAGADAVQLDFFYLPSLLGEPDFPARLKSLLRDLRTALTIPVMPKLSVKLPDDFILPILKAAGIEYLSLLDSVRVPCIAGDKLDADLNPATTSCFGGWQLPLTLGYTYRAAQAGFKVCAGGGIMSVADIRRLKTAGATTVQSATWLAELKVNGVREMAEQLRVKEVLPCFFCS